MSGTGKEGEESGVLCVTEGVWGSGGHIRCVSLRPRNVPLMQSQDAFILHFPKHEPIYVH